MDIKGFSSWTLSLIIILVALSWPQTAHGAGRMSNHFFLRFRNKQTTSPAPSDRDIPNSQADKIPGPKASPSPPSSSPAVYDAMSFLRYLFQKGRLPSVKLNFGGNKKEPTTTAATTTTTTTKRTTPTTTLRTSSLTTRTSRSVAADTTTARGNTNQRVDTSVRTNRPNMLPFRGATRAPSDRQAKIRAFDLWLLTNFKRPPLIAGNTNRPGSNNGNPNKVPSEGPTATPGARGQASPVSAPPTTVPSGNQNPGMNIQRGSVLIQYHNRQDQNQNRRTTEQADEVTDEPSRNVDITTEAGDRGRDSTPQVQVYDKPFHGAKEEWFHEDWTTGTQGETSRTTGTQGETTRITGTQGETTTVTSNTGANTGTTGNGNGRYRSARAIYKRAARSLESVDPACYEPYNFKPCEFYTTCFSKIDQACQPREAFIGDEVNRLCHTLMDTAESAESKLLKAYLSGVEQCLRKELYLVLEYPTCDDITQALGKNLLQKNHTNCLYQNGMFCSVINDEVARPDLARMLFEQTTDVDFMMRFLVNVGDMTLYCNGRGINIFLTDMMLLITESGSPFQLPSPPKPWFGP